MNAVKLSPTQFAALLYFIEDGHVRSAARRVFAERLSQAGKVKPASYAKLIRLGLIEATDVFPYHTVTLAGKHYLIREMMDPNPNPNPNGDTAS